MSSLNWCKKHNAGFEVSACPSCMQEYYYTIQEAEVKPLLVALRVLMDGVSTHVVGPTARARKRNRQTLIDAAYQEACAAIEAEKKGEK